MLDKDKISKPVLLRDLRISANMTQKELSQRAGVQASTVNRWENGCSTVMVETAIAVANTLGCAVEDLYYHRAANGASAPAAYTPPTNVSARMTMADIAKCQMMTDKLTEEQKDALRAFRGYRQKIMTTIQDKDLRKELLAMYTDGKLKEFEKVVL